MLEVKPSKQCFDGIFGRREKKKKGKSFFMNALDRKTPARDKGSTKKKKCFLKMMLQMLNEVH